MAPVKPIRTYERSNRSVNTSLDIYKVLMSNRKSQNKKINRAKNARKRKLLLKELPPRTDNLLDDDSLHISAENTFDKLLRGTRFNNVKLKENLSQKNLSSDTSSISKLVLKELSNNFHSPIITRNNRQCEASILHLTKSNSDLENSKRKNHNLQYCFTPVITRSKSASLFKSLSLTQSGEKIDVSLEVERFQKPNTSLSYIKLPEIRENQVSNFSVNEDVNNLFTTSALEKNFVHCSTPLVQREAKNLAFQPISPIVKGDQAFKGYSNAEIYECNILSNHVSNIFKNATGSKKCNRLEEENILPNSNSDQTNKNLNHSFITLRKRIVPKLNKSADSILNINDHSNSISTQSVQNNSLLKHISFKNYTEFCKSIRRPIKRVKLAGNDTQEIDNSQNKKEFEQPLVVNLTRLETNTYLKCGEEDKTDNENNNAYNVEDKSVSKSMDKQRQPVIILTPINLNYYLSCSGKDNTNIQSAQLEFENDLNLQCEKVVGETTNTSIRTELNNHSLEWDVDSIDLQSKTNFETQQDLHNCSLKVVLTKLNNENSKEPNSSYNISYLNMSDAELELCNNNKKSYRNNVVTKDIKVILQRLPLEDNNEANKRDLTIDSDNHGSCNNILSNTTESFFTDKSVSLWQSHLDSQVKEQSVIDLTDKTQESVNNTEDSKRYTGNIKNNIGTEIIESKNISDIIESSNFDESLFKVPLFSRRKKISTVKLKPGKSWRRSLTLLRRNSMLQAGTVDENSIERVLVNDNYCDPQKFKSRPSSICTRHSIRIVPVSPIVLDKKPSELETYAYCQQLTGYESDEPVINTEILQVSLRKLSLSTTGRPLIETSTVTNARDIVLRKCGQTEPLPFQECYPDSVLQNCQKIGEGVYGEVFLFRDINGGTTVMKVIPIEGNQIVNNEPQKKFEEILSEIVIALELSNLRNQRKQNHTSAFSEVKKIQCVQGRYPEKLLDLWDLYDETRGSENDSPEIFKDDQLYIVLELANGGKDLEAFIFNNASQAYMMFKQVACALAVAESELRFEHRDLHWGNVLLRSVDKNKMISFRLDDREILINTKGVEATIIDFTLSRIEYDGVVIYNDLAHDEDLFSADGDYQFEVYRLMQQKNGNDWRYYEPYTNLLWLHYLIDKAITGLRYKYVQTKIHKEYIHKFMSIKEDILNYSSVKDFINAYF